MEYRFSEKVANLKPSAIREIFKSLTDPTVISFAAGNPAPESFPIEQLKLLSDEIFSDQSVARRALQYGITEGYTPLRELIARRLKEKFSIGSELDETIVTTGGQQALDLCCRALVNEGDTVLCELPSFIGALNAFRACGANLVGVPLNESGVDLNALENALKTNQNVRFFYTIPTFQNPTGITATQETRKAVLELCTRYHVLILEDNPYGELRFAGREIPTIKSMDREGRVLYCGSFSKILSSGMRIGFLCAPREIVQKVVVLKQVNDVHTNLFFQMLCAEFLTRFDLDGHIEKIRALYRRKCALMLDALDRFVGENAIYTRPEGGLFIWCKTPDLSPSAPIVRACLKQKLAVVPGEAFLCDQSGVSDGFRLNYSMPSDEQIEQGAKILGQVFSNRSLG